jgi:hypothetical protein
LIWFSSTFKIWLICLFAWYFYQPIILTLTKIGYVKIWWRIGGEAGWVPIFAMGFASWLHPLRPLGPLFGTYGKTWTCFFNDVYHLVMADIAMEILYPPFLRTVNHLFLWAIYTMAMLNNQRVYFV